ncbi:NfeD family protein [Myceligenerans salitolerans]|uniref:NfeD family protein n=1 Tax=Myceligenerans salitolerans TaxID=1230528 RepID=A0ABS3I5T3_9MICO|nr:NfeD family protein [Myceligenerans salitolerans]MBO0608330.1 NfeD family protein [Myceligenerans salitolerans]
MEWLWWVGAALLLGLIEITTLDFVFIMFAGGALAAAGANAAGQPLWVQVIVFTVVATILLVTVRPPLKRYLSRGGPETLTNAEAHVGRTASVVEEVTDMTGLVKLMGEVWTARAAEGSPPLAEGSTVQVVRIDGATAVVAPKPVDHSA